MAQSDEADPVESIKLGRSSLRVRPIIILASLNSC